jgi:putative transposase
MDEFESLSHSKWECKYHVVFIPKYRRKVMYGELRKHLGEIFRKLAEQRESRVEEGHLLGPCAHDAVDTAEICGQSGHWVYERQERDSFSAGLW